MSDTFEPEAWETAPTNPFLRPARTRVLVAEDDPAMRRIVVGRLRRDGCDVLEVASGDAAVATLRASPELALVIMDVRMPGLSGVEVVHTLRAWKWNTPVLLMTAFPDPRLVDEAHRLGARVLAKPFGLARLSRAVVETLAPWSPR